MKIFLFCIFIISLFYIILILIVMHKYVHGKYILCTIKSVGEPFQLWLPDGTETCCKCIVDFDGHDRRVILNSDLCGVGRLILLKGFKFYVVGDVAYNRAKMMFGTALMAMVSAGVLIIL